MTPSFAVRMQGIVKTFGAVSALSGVDFDVISGEVHALLGENGAGKSTLMAVLFGLVRQDSGSVEVFGRALADHSPREALDAGVGLVQQHFSLVPRMSVAEHVALGRPGLRFDFRRARDLVRETTRSSGLALDPDALAADLSAGLRQRLEIVKTLARDVRVLVLDEPTALLAPAEAADLFTALRRLAARGIAVVLITHKLKEVADYADRVTVLRRGAVILRGRTADFTSSALSEAVVGAGSEAAGIEPALSLLSTALRAPAVSVRGLTVRSRSAALVHEVSFEVAAGEIVGVAAVEGNGQRELLRAVAGLIPFEGVVALPPGTTAAFLPEDRQAEGLVLDFDITMNLALGTARGFWLDRRRLEHRAAQAIDEYAIRTGGASRPVRELSGGNQQKVVVARALSARHPLIVAENPTRGLDVGSSEEVRSRLRRAAREEGSGILLHSSDLDEILAVSDRIAVMSGGHWRWVSEAERTRERVGALMLGAA